MSMELQIGDVTNQNVLGITYYKDNTEISLSAVLVNVDLLMCEDTNCTDPAHRCAIELLYNQITDALLEAGNSLEENCKPRDPFGSEDCIPSMEISW